MNPAAAPVASLAPIASLHRFDAYRLALAFRSHVVRWLPLKRAELSDQLDRASLSIALNIAEGAGRFPARGIRRVTTPSRAAAPSSASQFSTSSNSKQHRPTAAMPASSSFA